MLKILNTEYKLYPKKSLNKLNKYGFIDLIDVKCQDSLTNILNKKSYDIIITKLGLKIDKNLINKQKKLKFIVTPTTGLNHIDIDYAKKKSINIISLKGEDIFLKEIRSTAEHTWAILLALIRNIPNSIESVKNNLWSRDSLISNELYEKTIGIIGFGRLGKLIHKYAESFGMKILINDIDNNIFKQNKLVNTELNFLLRKSDVVSLHIDYRKTNYSFMDKKKFSLMKKNSIFINTSRGECVDENALIYFLKKKLITGAALDVLNNDSVWQKKISENIPLIEYMNDNDNLIITPHVGGNSVEAITKTRIFIIDKLLKTIKL